MNFVPDDSYLKDFMDARSELQFKCNSFLN